MIKDVLEELLGKRVEVWTGTGAGSMDYGIKDAGILEAYDDQWVKVRQEHGTTLYFSIVNIRLIKPA